MADLDFTVNADTRRAQQNLQNLENKIGNFKKAATGSNNVNVGTGRAATAIQGLQNKFSQLNKSIAAPNMVNVNTDRAVSNLRNLDSQSRSVANSLKGLGTVIAGIGLAAFVTRTLNLAAALSDLSSATNISIAGIRGFQQAVQVNGGSIEAADKAILKLNDTIGEAAEGSKTAQSAFARVGVSLQDLRTLSEEQILRKVVDGLGQIPDAATRGAVAANLLGKSVNGVNFEGVRQGLQGFVEEAKKVEETSKNMARVQDNLKTVVSNLENATLKAIGPLVEFLAKLEPAQIERFITAVVQLGVALVAIAGSVKLLASGWNLLSSVVTIAVATWLSFKAALAGTIAAVTAIGAAFAGVTAGLALYGVTLKTVLTTKVGLSILLANLKPLLLALIVPFSKLAGIIALVTAGVILLNKGIALLTGKGIGDWAKEAGKWLGLVKEDANKTADTLARLNVKPSSAGAGRGGQGGATAEELAAYNAEQDKRNVKIQQEADAKREVIDAMAAERAAIAKISADYQKSLDLNNQRYQQETNLIKLTGQAKEAQQLKNEAEITYQQELSKLADQIAAKRATGNAEDAAAADLLVAQQTKITEAYNKQRASIDGLVAAREKEVSKANLSNFASQQLVQNQQKLADIQNQMAKVGLPELAGKLKDLELATRATADAAIREEEVRRGGKLSQDEKLAYYKAASVGAVELANATRELAAAQEAYNQKLALENFMSKERQDTQDKIIDLQGEMAKSTMTDIERKYYDIEAAAKKNARAAIQAENARRKAAGTALLSATEEAAYYKIATEESKKLTDAQKEQVEQSRKFSTGWERSYKQYIEDAKDASKTAERVFKTATQGMEDAIVGFAKTGKFEWKSFVGSLAEELLRSEIKSIFGDMMNWMTGKTTDTTSMIGKAFGSMMGGAGQQGAGSPTQQGGGSSGLGNILDGIGKVFGGSGSGGGILESIGTGIKDIFGGFFANGGNLAAGKFGIVGERGPEMISGPATITPMQPTAVTYNINAVDAASFKALVAADPSFIYAVSMQGAKGIPGGR